MIASLWGGPVRKSGLLAVTLALLVLLLGQQALAGESLEVQVRLRATRPQIEGTVTFVSQAPVVSLSLPANRFNSPPLWNDLERHFLLAGPTFRPGGTEILSLTVDGSLHELPVASPEATHLDVETVNGETSRIVVEFRTTLPNVLDLFGAGAAHWVANEGWFPAPPDFRGAVQLRIDGLEGHLLAGGRSLEVGDTFKFKSPPALLVTQDKPAMSSFRVGESRVVLYEVGSPGLRHRVSHNRSPQEVLRETLEMVVEATGLAEIPIVVLPLGWLATGADRDVVWVSDRMFHVHPLLRPTHQRELAYAVSLHAALHESEDERWVSEGQGWHRAAKLYEQEFQSGREVRDWIGLFDMFAIVDRFDTAPRVPFQRIFFPGLDDDDPLALRSNERRPPGRTLFAKLKARLGPERFAELLRKDPARPFREHLNTIGGDDLELFSDAWRRPAGPVNYQVSGEPGVRLQISREGPPRSDSVELGAVGSGGTRRFFIELDSGEADLVWPADAEAIVVDPGRTWPETQLVDNRLPAEFQLLLDSSDVEVSSSEFGLSTLLVGRRRYDYLKDLALAGFFTTRSAGFHAGAQLHGGTAIDRNFYRHNLFAYYGFQVLDSGFRDSSSPSGHLAGLGFRYNLFDVYWVDNPSRSHHLRIFFDGFDQAFGSDFNFVQTGMNVAMTRPLREDTVVAMQLTHGSVVSTRGGLVPPQSLFSLGGFRGVRAIGAEDQLGRHLFVVRGELRHMLPVRLDLDFEDLLVARKLQVRVFVDAGAVDDALGRPYDVSRWAVGVGGGVNLFYDFLGFFPSSFYVDVAFRADESASPQFLFGGRQPF